MEKKQIIIISVAATLLCVVLAIVLLNKKELSFEQTNDYIEKGNDLFEEKEFEKSQIPYVRATTIDSTNPGANFNYANAQQKIGKNDLSKKQYEKALRNIEEKKINTDEEGKAELNALASNVYHNKGNNAMSQLTSLDSLLAVYAQLEEMEKAGTAPANAKSQIYNLIQDNYKKIGDPIKDYKSALRLDPTNDSTRYNLAIAQNYEAQLAKILQQMPPPPSNNQDQNDEKKDDKKDQQDQQQQQQQ
ncbi:MAG: hypothetical protein J6C20_09400 [Paludibacteraceae bacterium]|nr:hypothetical protein [Paludibacteraceae bacterium]